MSQYHKKNRPDVKRRFKFALKVFERDKGICAHCLLDCVKLLEKIKSVTTEDQRFKIAATFGISKSKLAEALHITQGRLWEIDHIIPLRNGGKTTLGNVRTLCPQCHKRVTARFNLYLKMKKEFEPDDINKNPLAGD